jgi:hypothetical protein
MGVFIKNLRRINREKAVVKEILTVGRQSSEITQRMRSKDGAILARWLCRCKANVAIQPVHSNTCKAQTNWAASRAARSSYMLSSGIHLARLEK